SETQTYVGEITNVSLENMRFGKIFFGGSGVKDGIDMTSSVAEAYTQKMALQHSVESYFLLDSLKVGKERLSKFCHLNSGVAISR
ncbi:DeoR family transcriptional regulator, partial [Enterococcus faecalis]